jgi:hypothetical protein
MKDQGNEATHRKEHETAERHRVEQRGDAGLFFVGKHRGSQEESQAHQHRLFSIAIKSPSRGIQERYRQKLTGDGIRTS